MTELVLSLFPGVGLLDRAFIAAGFCVVQAQDKITGGDIREFHGVPGRLNGIVAGPRVRDSRLRIHIDVIQHIRAFATAEKCSGIQFES